MSNDAIIGAIKTIHGRCDAAEFRNAVATILRRAHDVPAWILREVADRIDAGPPGASRGRRKGPNRPLAYEIASAALAARETRAEAVRRLSERTEKPPNASGNMLDDVIAEDIVHIWGAWVDFGDATWEELETGLASFYNPAKAAAIVAAARGDHEARDI